VIYAAALLLLFGGFVAVQLIALRRRKRHEAAIVPDQRLDLDPPADPDHEPTTWPPTR
jgi:cbb3-type cytochrome oxidase subunit 3